MPDMADYAAAKLNLLRNLPDGATVVRSVPMTPWQVGCWTRRPRPSLPAAWGLDDLLNRERELLSTDNVVRLGFSRVAKRSTAAAGWQAMIASSSTAQPDLPA